MSITWSVRFKNGRVDKDKAVDVGEVEPISEGVSSHRRQQIDAVQTLYKEAEKYNKTVVALVKWSFFKPGLMWVSQDGDWEQEVTEPEKEKREYKTVF